MHIVGGLATAALVAALTAGAAAQQMPGGSGNEANGPITILKNVTPEPAGVVVRVNGAEVTDLQAQSYADITTVVHRGSNTLSVTWSGPIQRLNFKIAYAPTRNNFKNVVVVQSDDKSDAALRRQGQRTLAFTIQN